MVSVFMCNTRKAAVPVPAGQRLGLKEAGNGIWLANFMHYDLGYCDLGQRNMKPSTTIRPEVVTRVLGTFRYLCVRARKGKDGCGGRI
jgi:hypothetical protein